VCCPMLAGRNACRKKKEETVATVLLVDDDRMVLALCGYILTDIGGLDVLQAGGSRRAIDVADHHCGKIDLLLSIL
jgi:hypothetical protein